MSPPRLAISAHSGWLWVAVLGACAGPLEDPLAVEPGRGPTAQAYPARERVSRAFDAELFSTATPRAVPLLVHVMPGRDAAAVHALLADHGLRAIGEGAAGAWTRISALASGADAWTLAQELGALPDVFFVERVRRLGFFNDRSVGSVQAGVQGTRAEATPIWAQGLRGEGQVVGLIDSGLDVDACWFRDDDAGKLPKTNTWSRAGGYGTEIDDAHRKVLAYDFLYSCDQYGSERGCEVPTASTAWDDHGHGTHCAGSMVGDRPDGVESGMAPAAKLVVQDGGSESNPCSEMPGLGCPVIDLYPIFAQAYAQGVRVHNNSYGDNEEAPAPQQSNYSARSQDVDRFMWDHKDMLIVFAAGNSGMGGRDFSVGSPSTNKNGLSVGSVRTSAEANSDDDISNFSSRGWSADGRVKPDLMAPGCTVSAGNDGRIGSNNCADDTGCGTSYAAPVVVGAAALVRQYFSEGFYPSGARRAEDALDPSAALIKAMLLNGAVALRGRDHVGQSIAPIPSHEQGWGRVQLDRSLLFQGAARKLYVDDHRAGFESGETARVSYRFAGVSSAEPLKVTLTWTDFPGAVDAPPRAPRVDEPASLNAPVLVNDLDLTVETDGETFLGNAFAEGASRAGGEPDQRNNVEQVLIARPSGEVAISVAAASIAEGGQDFALVVTGQWQRVIEPEAPADAVTPQDEDEDEEAEEVVDGLSPGSAEGARRDAGRPDTSGSSDTSRSTDSSEAADDADTARSDRGCALGHAGARPGDAWMLGIAALLLSRKRRFASSAHGPSRFSSTSKYRSGRRGSPKRGSP